MGEWFCESGVWDRCVWLCLPPVRRKSAYRASTLPRGAESGRNAGSVCDGMHVGRARRSVLSTWEIRLGASFFGCLNMAGEVASHINAKNTIWGKVVASFESGP